MRIIVLQCLLWFAPGLMAQVTIGPSTPVKFKGDFAFAGSLTNSSQETDFTETNLFMVGENQLMTSVVPLSLASFQVDTDGVFTLIGDWTITEELLLTKGVLEPSGKLTYTGAKTLEGSAASYIAGALSQKGPGTRFFPIGTPDEYLPMSLNEVTRPNDEMTVQAFSSAPDLSASEDVSAIGADRYWQVNPATGAATVSLYVKGSSLENSSNVVALQGDAGGVADNLKGGVTKDFVTSFLPVSKPVLALGVARDPELRIHDLITPHNQDEVNDKLKIVNIESTFSNTVYLLDRYGVLIRKWDDFRNYDDPDNSNPDNFDFTRLSPGNYICILEYRMSAAGAVNKINQMVTVLKEK